MLDKLLEENEFMAVYFCKYSDKNNSAWNVGMEQEVIFAFSHWTYFILLPFLGWHKITPLIFISL
jgi:hypothetical protein